MFFRNRELSAMEVLEKTLPAFLQETEGILRTTSIVEAEVSQCQWQLRLIDKELVAYPGGGVFTGPFSLVKVDDNLSRDLKAGLDFEESLRPLLENSRAEKKGEYTLYKEDLPLDLANRIIPLMRVLSR